MSTFRKTVLTTAIIGAGLASTSGAAFATECHDGGHGQHKAEHSSSKGCSNLVKADNSSGAGSVKLGAVTGGIQTITPTNICDNLNGNKVLSGNNVALPGGTVHNGNTTTSTSNEATAQGKGATAILGGLF